MGSRKLYLIRHGEAELPTINTQRPLSIKGQQQVEQLAQCLRQEGAKPQHLFHSGILRAQQTAQILAQWLNIALVKKMANLLPDDAIEPILQEIDTWTVDTLLVGHLPYMAELLWSLAPAAYAIQFDTATAVSLEQVDGAWLVQGVWR